jgi:hypothetical protein
MRMAARWVGWDEILQGGLSQNATVMSWRGMQGGIAAAKQGHDAILTPNRPLYFNYRQSEATDEPAGRDPVNSLADVYNFQAQPAELTPAEQTHILGVQGSIWTEYILTEDRVQHMLFPRAAGVVPARIQLSAVAPKGGGQRDLLCNGPPQCRVALEGKRVKRRGQGHQQRLSVSRRRCVDFQMEQDPIRNAERPVFRVVYSRPCWVYRNADLDRFTKLTVGIGSIPYIFQSQGKPLPSRSDATSTQAQIAVHMDSCAGELLAKAPLRPAYRKVHHGSAMRYSTYLLQGGKRMRNRASFRAAEAHARTQHSALS